MLALQSLHDKLLKICTIVTDGQRLTGQLEKCFYSNNFCSSSSREFAYLAFLDASHICVSNVNSLVLTHPSLSLPSTCTLSCPPSQYLNSPPFPCSLTLPQLIHSLSLTLVPSLSSLTLKIPKLSLSLACSLPPSLFLPPSITTDFYYKQ